MPKLGVIALFVVLLTMIVRGADAPSPEPPRIIVGAAVLDIAIPAPASQGGSEKTVSMEKLSEILVENGREFRQKIAAARKLVDADAAAGKITEATAQSLRWSLRIAGESGKEIREMLASIRVPSQADALSAAVQEIGRAATTLVKQREATLREAIRTLSREVAGAVGGTPSSAEVGKLIQTVETAERAMERVETDFNEPVIPWRQAGQVLRALKDVIASEESGSHQDLGTAAQMFRNACQGSWEMVPEEQIKMRIARVQAPLMKQAGIRQDALDAALLARRPPQEIARLFQEYATALDGVEVARANQGAQESRGTIAFYRKLLEIIGSVDAGETPRGNQERLREIRQALDQLGPARSARFNELLQNWEKTLEQRTAAAWAKRVDSIRDRLAGVKTLANLEAIVADLASSSRESTLRGEAHAGNFPGLAETLNALSAAWLSLNPAFLQADRLGQVSAGRFDSAALPHPFAKEISALRKLVERDILIKGLNVPELATPPLSDLPTDAALDAFCDTLAKQGDWKRLMTFLQARSAVSPLAVQRHDETLEAIRSYLIGRNFETAEQWGEAIQSYKAVLRSTSGRAPIKEAADRLKAIAKEHPEAASPPAATLPTGAASRSL